MKVAIVKSESKFEKYRSWLEHFNIEFEVLDHNNNSEDLLKFDNCRGIIFVGGVDIYPELYCDWDTAETKGTYSPERDGFELKLMEKALARKIPVLCICRGMQLMNIYFRGSLIFDLEEIRNVNHKKISPTEDRWHSVNIFPGTLLHEIIGKDKVDVTSSHHQAVDRLGEGLIISARSDDGTIEGIEFADKMDKSFLIGIQWHPERFHDYENPASKNIIERFKKEVSKLQFQSA